MAIGALTIHLEADALDRRQAARGHFSQGEGCFSATLWTLEFLGKSRRWEGDMRRMLALAVVGPVLVVAASTRVSAQSGPAELQGAWAVQEVTYAEPPANPPNGPSGLIQFSGGHYSIMYIGDGTRPDFGEGGTAAATADQLRAIWGPLTANAGTFTVTGSTVRFSPSVAKMPTVMDEGSFYERTFVLDGDHLTLTTVRSDSGPSANPQTIRLTRAK